MLTQNQQTIIMRFMAKNEEISSSEIQRTCNLSRKTLTSEIQAINHYLQKYGARIDTLKGKGYCLKIEEAQKYNTFRIEFMNEIQRNRYLYIEKNYLAYLIIFELVSRDSYINIDALAEKFHYSRGTISKSIKIAKGILAKYNCNLCGKPNYGLKLDADEWTKRICLLFLDKIVLRINAIIPETRKYFGPLIDKDREKYPVIERIVEDLLFENHIQTPYVNLIKIKMYIQLSQIRSEYYYQLFIMPEYEKAARASHCFQVSRRIAHTLANKNIIIRDKDILALSILLISFSIQEDETDIEPEKLQECTEDMAEFIKYISHLYAGVKRNFDEKFMKEFSRFLIGVKKRLFFQVPSDGEVGNLVKNDGAFILELCKDFSSFFYKKYKVIIPEAELFNAYFIISDSFLRNSHKMPVFSIALISRYGTYFVHNVAEHILQQYHGEFLNIDTFEFINARAVDWGEYDFLLTDIPPVYYNFVPIPIIKLDFYREPQNSKSLAEHLSLCAAIRLHEIIIDSNLIKNKKFTEKADVFDYLAANYVLPRLRQEFIENCILKDSFISGERCNRIVFISTSPEYYNKKQIIILFSKTPFFWSDEKVQMIVFFNRKGHKYTELKFLSMALACFLHSDSNISQVLSQMDADAIVDYIVNRTYKS